MSEFGRLTESIMDRDRERARRAQSAAVQDTFARMSVPIYSFPTNEKEKRVTEAEAREVEEATLKSKAEPASTNKATVSASNSKENMSLATGGGVSAMSVDTARGKARQRKSQRQRHKGARKQANKAEARPGASEAPFSVQTLNASPSPVVEDKEASMAAANLRDDTGVTSVSHQLTATLPCLGRDASTLSAAVPSNEPAANAFLRSSGGSSLDVVGLPKESSFTLKTDSPHLWQRAGPVQPARDVNMMVGLSGGKTREQEDEPTVKQPANLDARRAEKRDLWRANSVQTTQLTDKVTRASQKSAPTSALAHAGSAIGGQSNLDAKREADATTEVLGQKGSSKKPRYRGGRRR